MAIVVAAVSSTAAAVSVPGRTELGAPGLLLLLAASLVLVARRRAPVVVLLVTTGCLLAYRTGGYPGPASGLPELIAVYTAVLAGRRLVAVACVGGAFVISTLVEVLAYTGQPGLREIVAGRMLLVGWVVAAVMAAEMRRQWQANLTQSEQRAADAERRAADAERIREETALRRAGEERLRIARELHDSLTHSISVIKIQAGVAVHLARKRGEEVPGALMAIQEAAGDASRELRGTLGLLRDPGAALVAGGLGSVPSDRVPPAGPSHSGPGGRSSREGPSSAGPLGGGPLGGGPPDAGPPDAGPPDAGPLDAGPPDTDQPGGGLARIPELVERTRGSGLPTTVVVSGEQRALPPELDRAVYRIVQEALTNAARHAGPATAAVRLGFLPEAFTVRVDDDGEAAYPGKLVLGTGLTGMRERVTALGGRLHTGPRPGGGFSVRAEFPLAGSHEGQP